MVLDSVDVSILGAIAPTDASVRVPGWTILRLFSVSHSSGRWRFSVPPVGCWKWVGLLLLAETPAAEDGMFVLLLFAFRYGLW